MGQRTTGVCRLCGTKGSISSSHILPQWIYRRIHSEPRDIVMMENMAEAGASKAYYSSKQIREYMLCAACEQNFSRVEKTVGELAFGRDGISFPLLDDSTNVLYSRMGDIEAVYIDKIKARALARFAVSVVWRTSVCSNSITRDASLGNYEELLKPYLRDEHGTLPKTVRVIVAAIRKPDYKEADLRKLATLPVTDKSTGEGFRAHRFGGAGLYFDVGVGGSMLKKERERCITRTQNPSVLVSRGLDIGFYKELPSAVSNTRSKGRLGQE